MKLNSFLAPVGLFGRLLILFGLMATGLLLFSLIVLPFTMMGAETTALMRFMQFLQSVLLFIVPSIVLAFFISGRPWKYLEVNKAPSWRQVILTILSMLIMLPFMNKIIAWNEGIHLPTALQGVEDWMREHEDSASGAIAMMLNTPSWGIRLINWSIVGIMAALSEELFFRGVLQNLFLDKWHKRLLAVLLSAFLFSAIHLQFYGFVPRFLLGAYFGLLLIWTGNLWLPILAHFINNTVALIEFYYKQQTEAAESIILATPTEWLMAGGSLLLFIYIAFCIKKSGA